MPLKKNKQAGKKRTVRNSMTSPQEFEREERIAKVLELRMAGLSIREIAKHVGFNKSTVHEYIVEALESVNKERAEQLFALEVSRLERLNRTHWGDAIKGDTKATELVLAISDRRRKIHGLDAAEKHEVVVGEASPERAAQLVREKFGDHAIAKVRPVESEGSQDAGEISSGSPGE